MTKRILVIEDEYEHKQDAKKFFETRPEIDVVYARTYVEASEVMFGQTRGSIDGVISDIYFPLTTTAQWSQPEPIGVRVAVELSQSGTPFVLCTSGYHHGRKYEWICQFARKQGWEIIDTGVDYEQETDSKDWKRAYESLEKKMK